MCGGRGVVFVPERCPRRLSTPPPPGRARGLETRRNGGAVALPCTTQSDLATHHTPFGTFFPTMTQQEKQHQGVATQSLIRKLTTEKAVKAHRQQTSDKDASEDDITNIKLSSRGIKTIESLDLPSLRC